MRPVVVLLVLVASLGTSLGGDWGLTQIRPGLVAAWRWPAGTASPARPHCVVYLSGVEGWAGEAPSISQGDDGAIEVVGEGATVALACPDRSSGRLAGHPVSLVERPLWLVYGIGEPGRGPAVRPLGGEAGQWPRGADVATELYEASSDLRAAIHYTR